MSATTLIGLNKITVTASIVVPYKADRKKINYTLRSNFVAIDPKTGVRKKFRYYGKSGQEEAITIEGAIIFDLDDKTDAANYQTLLLHLETDEELRSKIVIIDEVKDAETFADKEVKMAAAVYMLTSAYDQQAYEKLANIYRRKYGSVSGVTHAMVLQTLTTLAKQEPEEVLALAKDAESEVKILIDRAVEEGIMLREGEAYVTKDSRLVAKDEVAMVRFLDENPSFKATLDRQVELVVAQRQPAPKKNPLIEIIGETVSEGLGLHSDVKDTDTQLSKEDILHIVKLGVKTQFIDSKNDKYIVHGKEMGREAVDHYYQDNVGEAAKLKEELVGANLWVDLT